MSFNSDRRRALELGPTSDYANSREVKRADYQERLMATSCALRALIIGGSGFIGSYVMRKLSRDGHTVAVFHRGERTTPLPREVTSIIGDRRRLSDYAGELERFAPDVVIDQIANELGYAEGAPPE